MGPNRRRLQREEARVRAAERQRHEQASALDIAEAAQIIWRGLTNHWRGPTNHGVDRGAISPRWSSTLYEPICRFVR